MFDAMDASFAVYRGDLSDEVEGVVAREDVLPLAAVWACSAAALASALTGRYDATAKLAEHGRSAAARCESGLQRHTLGFAEVLALVGRGDPAAALVAAQREAQEALGDPRARAISGIMLGWAHHALGHLREAAADLERAGAVMAHAGPSGWAMVAGLSHAQVAAALGRVDEAQAALTAAEACSGPHVAVFAPDLELARAWVRAAGGETTAAAGLALHAGTLARPMFLWGVEARALHTAVRFGQHGCAPRLRELTRLVGGPLVGACAEHARAVDRADPGGLQRLSRRFEALGMPLLAADAAAQAAALFARVGTARDEATATSRARVLATQGDGARSPALDAVDRPLPLTRREREIAGLAASGFTNKEIAERLTVSVRTVEGHLYRVFGKLGVEGRQDLATVIGSADRM